MITRPEVINVYSQMNPEYDFVFIINSGNEDEAAKLVDNAMYEWYEKQEEIGDMTMFEYICQVLSDKGFEFEGYIKETCNDEQND